MAKKTLQELIDAGDVMGALKSGLKTQARGIAARGNKAFPSLSSLASIWSQARKNAPAKPPKDQPPEDKPGEEEKNLTKNPAITPRASNNWSDIVGSHFTDRGAKYYNEGGLVRGGGKAVKGRGRGKMV